MSDLAAVNEPMVTITKDYWIGSSQGSFRYQIEILFPDGQTARSFCSLWPRHQARKMIRKRRVPTTTRYLGSEL
jgi:hypothetical protein